MQLERREAYEASHYLNRTTRDLAWKLYNLTMLAEGDRRLNESEWKLMGEATMRSFTGRIYELHKELDQAALDGEVVDKWAFSRSVFFAATTLTSIGKCYASQGHPLFHPPTFRVRQSDPIDSIRQSLLHLLRPIRKYLILRLSPSD